MAQQSEILAASTGADRVGIARVVIRGRQYLLALMVQNSAIIANRLRFTQELVDPSQFNLPTSKLQDYGVSAEELDIAEQLVRALSTEWQPERYHDEYRDALMDWIDKKVRTGEGLTPAQEAPVLREDVVSSNLVELLRRSLNDRGK